MDERKYIRSASYYLRDKCVQINDYEFVSEGKTHYYGIDKNGNGYRFKKDNIGKPILKNTSSPFCLINVFMIDADDSTLIESLSKWFTDNAQEILNMKSTE